MKKTYVIQVKLCNIVWCELRKMNPYNNSGELCVCSNRYEATTFNLTDAIFHYIRIKIFVRNWKKVRIRNIESIEWKGIRPPCLPKYEPSKNVLLKSVLSAIWITGGLYMLVNGIIDCNFRPETITYPTYRYNMHSATVLTDSATLIFDRHPKDTIRITGAHFEGSSK